ncbi:hypothetical protein [Mycolicibacterium austroafricanum]|uniref:hypothetical protein n=1 Tax=Mycolicibacterium austroafricanum TaxID=39687 RepID=UPI001CA329D7|nr:hypothetical protein [Mycolicibacterium austroafricanum]QZT56726.1 hypothetical protein JN084_28180 [Mycolicibacterium austroafricanum]
MSANADPWGLRKIQGPQIVIEADDYRIGEGFVTFLRGDKAFLSMPVSKVGLVAELTEDNELPLGPLE